MSSYEPADHGTFMSRVLDTIKQNPGMAAAGASMLGSMRGGDMAKFAVAAFAAYKLYSAYEKRQHGELESSEPKTPVGKRLVGAAVSGAKIVKDKAVEGINKGKTLYANFSDDMFASELDARMSKIAAYDKQTGSAVDPKTGFSRAQLDAAIESVAPMSETPTLKSMAEAAGADKHGEAGKRYRSYLDNVAHNAEHKMAWDAHLDKAGVSDLSELKFCALDSSGNLLKNDKNKNVLVDPYAKLKDMPHGKDATAVELYQYQAAKAEIDKTVQSAIDHGQICGMKGDVKSGFTRIDAPSDWYNRNLNQMDASNREFADVKASIREEQVVAYYEAPNLKKTAATPSELQATGKSADFQSVVLAVNGFRAFAQRDRALAAERGVDFDRVQIADMFKSARPTSIDFEAKPVEKTETKQAGPEQGAKQADSAPKQPEARSAKSIGDSVARAMQEADAIQERLMRNAGIGMGTPDFAPLDGL